MAASIGLGVVYALGGQVQLEGLLLFFALGGIAVGFIVWGQKLLPQGGRAMAPVRVSAAP